MYTRKRLCPFEESTDQISFQFRQAPVLKKPCFHVTENIAGKENMEITNGSSIHVRMEDEDLIPVDKQPVFKTDSVLNNAAFEQGNNMFAQNNLLAQSHFNNTQHMIQTDVCFRCQAGESGHFGHIGR